MADASPVSGANFLKDIMYWTYILQNPHGKFYIGQTGNLEVRVANYNRTDIFAGKFSRKNGPWNLVWSEPHATRAAALARERQIKFMKSARWIRETLLNGKVPTCQD